MRCWGPSRRARILGRASGVGAVLAALTALDGGAAAFLSALALALLLSSCAYTYSHIRVCADDDGVEVRGVSTRRRVAWSDVTTITPFDHRGSCAVINLRRGARITIPKLVLDGSVARNPDERDAIVAELERLRRAADAIQSGT